MNREAFESLDKETLTPSHSFTNGRKPAGCVPGDEWEEIRRKGIPPGWIAGQSTRLLEAQGAS
jgi:hypothetical protein